MLRTAIWEKGFKGGHVTQEYGLSLTSIDWLDKAMDAYYRKCIYSILDQIDNHASSDVLKSWEDLLNDMCGDNQTAKSDIIEAAMKDNKVSQAAKVWLKKITK